MMRLCVLAVFVLALCSCLVFAPQRAHELYVDREYRAAIGESRLTLDCLAVQKGFDSAGLEANAAYILHLMLARRNQNLSDTSAQALSLRALIKEEEFSRDYRPLNTVSVELSIFDPPRESAVALALYSETTKQTIASYGYLHSVIRRALRQLSRAGSGR